MSVTTRFTCNVSGISAGPGPDPDVPTPLGWLAVTVEQVIDNPEYVDAVERMEAQLADVDQRLAADGIDEQTRETTLMGVRRQTEANLPDPTVVRSAELHVHPVEIDGFLSKIGISTTSLS